MNSKKFNTISYPYLLAYVGIPLLIFAISICLTIMVFTKGTMAVIFGFGVPLLCILWWSLGAILIFWQKRKKLIQSLEESGFVCDNSFKGKGSQVMVDSRHGKLALLFIWNPFEMYVIPTSEVEKAWVDDGSAGKGFMKGSSRVSFLFIINGKRVRVNTFSSNKRWRMDSSYILTAISKADVMVEVLEAAKKQGN